MNESHQNLRHPSAQPAHKPGAGWGVGCRVRGLAVACLIWAVVGNAFVRADPPIKPKAIPVVEDAVKPAGVGTGAGEPSAGSGHEAEASEASEASSSGKPAGAPEWVREQILAGERANEEGGVRAAFEARLEVARRQRRNGNQEAAVRDLVGILRSTGPNDIKRPALLELAGIAEEAGQMGRAQQILAQYARLFPQHPSVVEVYLRQGLLYREMGATELSLAKFHAVFSSALGQRFDQLDYYRRLVLQAQTEIAETYYLNGRWDEAREYFQRVMRLDMPRVTKMLIHYKLVRVLSQAAHHDQTVAMAKQFAERFPDAGQLPEVRFLLATTLKKLGQNTEALEQVLLLLAAGKSAAAERPEEWLYWQKRAGNDIANQLYQEGDYAGTLEIYRRLAELDPSAAWQLPVWYQIGLVYERLEQPAKAAETYDRISGREAEVKADTGAANLMLMVEMAKWRRANLDWMRSATANAATLRPFVISAAGEGANGKSQ